MVQVMLRANCLVDENHLTGRREPNYAGSLAEVIGELSDFALTPLAGAIGEMNLRGCI
jgi:hypothetical protein